MRKDNIVPDQWLDVKIPGMRIDRTWIVALVLGALLVMAGCNAISFFPHEAAEKAADKVLDDIFPGESAQKQLVKPIEPTTPKAQ